MQFNIFANNVSINYQISQGVTPADRNAYSEKRTFNLKRIYI